MVLGVHKVLEAVLPETHVFEAAAGLLVRLNPVRRTERHHQRKETSEGDEGSEDNSIGGSWIIALLHVVCGVLRLLFVEFAHAAGCCRTRVFRFFRMWEFAQR